MSVALVVKGRKGKMAMSHVSNTLQAFSSRIYRYDFIVTVHTRQSEVFFFKTFLIYRTKLRAL
jgi:hypothetical protein